MDAADCSGEPTVWINHHPTLLKTKIILLNLVAHLIKVTVREEQSMTQHQGDLPDEHKHSHGPLHSSFHKTCLELLIRMKQKRGLLLLGNGNLVW